MNIAVGHSRKSKTWKHKDLNWKELTEMLSTPVRTKETHKEYRGMSIDQRGEVKDVGGFVGGTLKKGVRKKGYVAWRSLITLDVDHATLDFWGLISLGFNYRCLLYSTHSHSLDTPRYRLVIPLEHPIEAEKYEPVSRKIAELLGIEYFDKTTYQSHRLMYYPSASVDGEFEYHAQAGDTLNADDIINSYAEAGLNWKDPYHWARHDSEKVLLNKDIKKQGNPLEKPGVIGAFNRVYTIESAIEEFIPDVYNKAEDNRFTFLEGSTYGGLVVYDETLAYSHHESDPCGLRLVNAFDMIRLHLFGEDDEGVAPGVGVTKLPSYKSMVDLAIADIPVKIELSRSKLEDASLEFSDLDEAELEWMGDLRRTEKGNLVQSIENVSMILSNDINLKGKMGVNEFSGRSTLLGKLPWRGFSNIDSLNMWNDADLSQLYAYMENYGITAAQKINVALDIEFQRNSFHPIREYLDKLVWDGIERLDKLFIEYLGADNTEYTRAVTKKSLVACVKRVYEPGSKHDTLIVLIGKQGIGKSTILDKMGKQWFSDTLDDMKGKDAYGQLQGNWIIELAELNATRKTDIEAVKHFISKRKDDYRKPYDRYESSIPRQCVFFGTTNDYNFLNDPTGNRRFLPITTSSESVSKNIWEDLDNEIDLLWAEAKHLYDNGYSTYLGKSQVKLATEVQRMHTQEDPIVEVIYEFLNRTVPKYWYDKTPAERMAYNDMDLLENNPNVTQVKQTIVTSRMIWIECLGRNEADFNRADARRINIALENMDDWKRLNGATINGYSRQRGFRRLI